MVSDEIRELLELKAAQFNSPSFIEDDPISIGHRFSRKEDIEIASFLAASIAWGNRKSILQSASRMMYAMDNDPFSFVMNHSSSDLKKLKGFVHRTFNGDDFIQFVRSLKHIYERGGMEDFFTRGFSEGVGAAHAISYFRDSFFEEIKTQRTLKHVSDPLRGSSAKRMNMFLRWMVRRDKKGVDFGLWKDISMADLSLPLDVHTGNIARRLGLLHRKQNDWKAVAEIDSVLRSMDPKDPVKFDFALFGLGAIEKF